MTFEPLEPTASNLPGWLRKAAGIINRLQRTAEGLATRIGTEGQARQNATGWGNYSDSGTTQSVAANMDTPLVNNRANVIETQLPSDITTFYDGSRIRVSMDDLVTIQTEFKFTPADGTATMLTTWLDIGGGFAPLFLKNFPLTMGSGIEHPITDLFQAYARETFVQNGGRIMLRADGPGAVTARRFLIGRTHHGR